VDASITQRIVTAAAEATEVTISAAGAHAPARAAIPLAAMIPAAAEVTNVITTAAGTPVRVTAAMVAALAEAGRVPTASIGASATGRSGWLISKRT
jgi:hypothetical protein